MTSAAKTATDGPVLLQFPHQLAESTIHHHRLFERGLLDVRIV